MSCDDGLSPAPAHPPLPKKPALTPKPSIPPKRNGLSASVKSPAPKPKPRVSQRTPNGAARRTPNGSPASTLSRAATTSELSPAGGKNNNGDGGNECKPSDLIISAETPVVNKKDEIDACAEIVSSDGKLEEVVSAPDVADERIANGQPSPGANLAPSTTLQPPERKPPPPKPMPRSPNPKPPPRRAKSVYEPNSLSPKTEVNVDEEVSKPSDTTTTTDGTTSQENATTEHSERHSPDEETPPQAIPVRQKEENAIKQPEQHSPDEEAPPAIPVRRKRLSRDPTSPVFSGAIQKIACNAAAVGPPKTTDNSSSISSIEECSNSAGVNSPVSSSAVTMLNSDSTVTSNNSLAETEMLPSTNSPIVSTSINSATVSTPTSSPAIDSTTTTPAIPDRIPSRSSPRSPARPPLPNKRKPLKECIAHSIAIDCESPPPPPVNPRRTDANGNPPIKIRAKSEYIKNKPTRPPLPAVKPTKSLGLGSSAPPPKHPKPIVRKAKSQFIPKTAAPFTVITDIDIEGEDQMGPLVPARRSRSLEDVLDSNEPPMSPGPGNTDAVWKSSLDSQSNSPLPPEEVSRTGDRETLQEHTFPVPPVPTRKPMASSSPRRKGKKSSAKLSRSLTVPEKDNPPLVPRKTPPLPVKPMKTSPPQPDDAIVSNADPSSWERPTSPISRNSTPSPSPSKKSFSGKHASPKHRPRMAPPPPPPVRTNSEEIPEPPKRITSRSKSLDGSAFVGGENNFDPNGNIARTANRIEEENAKNAASSHFKNHHQLGVALPIDTTVCNRDSEDSLSSSSAVQSTSDDRSMSSSISRNNSFMSEDDNNEYVLPDLQSPPPSPLKKLSRPTPSPQHQDDQIYINKRVASVRPSRRKAPPRPVKPGSSRKTSLPNTPASPTSPISPNGLLKPPGSSSSVKQQGKRSPPTKPVRRSLSINSDVSDGYEDMSKGSSLASSLGIAENQMCDLYSVPRSCEHTLHDSGRCSCAQQYAEQESSEDDGGRGSLSDEDDDEDDVEGSYDYENIGKGAGLMGMVASEDAGGDGIECSLEGNAKKAYLVAREIRDSERVFVDVLKLLNKDFRQAIDQATIKEDRSVIEPLLLQQILGHLPQLQMFNEELLQDLDDRVDNWSDSPSISSIFLKKGPYLKLYSSYIRDFAKITTVFDEACGRFPLFGAAVRDFELSERCQNLAIKHYMLKPIQRIPQYKMLLTDYLKQLEAGTSEHAETSAALNIVSEVANHANECMRQGDNFGKLLQIQHSLIGNHEIVKPGRVFIKEGELLKLSRKVMQPRKFFLMNDILLYTTPFPPGQYKLNNVLSLAGTRVCKPQQEDFKNEFNIISVQRSFTLSASTPEERDDWMRALSTAISDYAAKRSSFSVLQPQLMEGDTSSLGRKAPIWIPDSRVTMCMICTCEFTITWRRHHCRACGNVVCGNCSMNKVPLMYLSQKNARVCEDCFHSLAKGECEEEGGEGKERKAKSKRKRSLKETKRPSALKEVSASEIDTSMSGYLHVKRKKDWKRMWFVLKGKVLYTYRASEDVAALESMPLLGYEIKVVTEYYEGIEPGLVMQLFHQGRVMSVFRTESKAAAEKWAFAMIDATKL